MTILDKKIKPGKRPLTCLDVDQAREFEGKKCFMASGLSYFSDLSNFEDIRPFNFSVGNLMVIDDSTDHVFYNADTKLAYRYVLPCEWVGQKSEKITFEPYTLETFEKEFNIGDVVMFRGKSNTDRDGSNYKHIYSGYRLMNYTTTNQHYNTIIVTFGLWGFSFEELFELYEINRGGNWEPFGRKVENIDICAGA